ncbi:hypothetical protein AX14_007626, partial [Amanita brunnescens Koide BX004]
DACRYLVQDHQSRAARQYLTTEDPVDDTLGRNSWAIPLDASHDNASWHLYLDNFEHLQVSI